MAASLYLRADFSPHRGPRLNPRLKGMCGIGTQEVNVAKGDRHHWCKMHQWCLSPVRHFVGYMAMGMVMVLLLCRTCPPDMAATR